MWPRIDTLQPLVLLPVQRKPNPTASLPNAVLHRGYVLGNDAAKPALHLADLVRIGKPQLERESRSQVMLEEGDVPSVPDHDSHVDPIAWRTAGT